MLAQHHPTLSVSIDPFKRSQIVTHLDLIQRPTPRFSNILNTTCYRIYSINRPGRLLNFWTLRVGAYSRWALIRGWALIRRNTVLPIILSEITFITLVYVVNHDLGSLCDTNVIIF